MQPLSIKEYNVAMVMASFLMKGNPETRIVKYLIEQKLTEAEVQRLLKRLGLPEGWDSKIYNRFRDIHRGCNVGDDNAQRLGKEIQKNATYTRPGKSQNPT